MEELSNETNIIYGVPQGSILGPILFILYVNNIYYPSNFEQFLQYADDTVITFTATTLRGLELTACEKVKF